MLDRVFRLRENGTSARTELIAGVTTYTVSTHYRAATEVEAGWIRILNFHVDGFGEWQIGSEEPVKSPSVQRVPVG